MNAATNPIPSNLTFGSPREFEGLDEIPIFSGATDRTMSYLTLDEALELKVAHITETSESGNVPELFFENLSAQAVFLMDGEELVGAKQNRVLNLSLMVSGQSKTVIPVSCVESGRWSFNKRDFSGSDRIHFSRGRARKMASVSESMSLHGMKRSNQGEVWSDIDAKFQRMKSRSSTSAMSDLFEQSNTKLNEYVDRFPQLDGQTGGFYFIHGIPIGFDLFDQPRTFGRLRSKIIKSYAIDAAEQPEMTSSDVDPIQATRFIESIQNGRWEKHAGTGLGSDLRMMTPSSTSAALVVDEITIHLSGFALDQTKSEFSNSGLMPAHMRRRFRRS